MHRPSLTRTPSLTQALSQSSSSSNSTSHSSELPVNRTPSPSVPSILPPEGSDEGEPMSLSDLLAPNDVLEVQDLEHDLEWVLMTNVTCRRNGAGSKRCRFRRTSRGSKPYLF